MSIAGKGLKEAGCGKSTNPQVNLWSDEQETYIRLHMRVSLLTKMKSNSYTEPYIVNAADGWKEACGT